MALIEIHDLTKVYRTAVKAPGLRGAVAGLFRPMWRETVAVSSVSFDLRAGQALACLGENGAGKSTLIKMLVGILTPSGGQIRVEGKDPFRRRREYLREVGVIFGQKTNLWWELPTIESFRAAQVFYRLPMNRYRERLDEFTGLLDLGPLLDIPARKLSLGQRMRADIALCLLHEPKILFLDEPTIGLDIQAKNIIRKFIRDRNQRSGVTVLLTSHDLNDIEQICDDAVILSRGRLIFDGTLDRLKAAYAPRKVLRITGAMRVDIRPLLPMDVEVTRDAAVTRITYDYTHHSSGPLLESVVRCFDVDDIAVQEPGIEAVVEEIYRSGVWGGRP